MDLGIGTLVPPPAKTEIPASNKAVEIPTSSLKTEMTTAKANGTLRGLGNGASFTAFEREIPLDESAIGVFNPLPNSKAFKRTSEDGTVAFYLSGQVVLTNGKKATGRISLNGQFSTSADALMESDPEIVLSAIAPGARVYLQHRQFKGNDGKNVVFIPAYPIVG